MFLPNKIRFHYVLICVITCDLEYNLTAREGRSGKYVTMCPFLSFSHVAHKTKLCVEYTGIYQGKRTTCFSFSLLRRKTIRLFFDHLIPMEIHEILRYIPSPFVQKWMNFPYVSLQNVMPSWKRSYLFIVWIYIILLFG